MSDFQHILDKLPYTVPFLFVDKLTKVTENGIEGCYTFKKEEYFYSGHFKNNPITPGVILTECMAQIGVVCLGIFISSEKDDLEPQKIVLSHSEGDYFLPVFPGESVTVISEKVYFRFGKLKCKIKMLNEAKEVVCKGIISGMIVSK